MLNNNFVAVFAVFILLLNGCATKNLHMDIQVEANGNPKIQLHGYKTYVWVGATGLLNDPTNKWQTPTRNVAGDIENLIESEMRKLGLTLVDEQEADLAVAYFIGVDKGAMKLRKQPKTEFEILENIPEAALVVSIIDKKTGYVIWISKATAEIQQNISDQAIRKRLDYAISTMFAKIPKD